jgi:hypothetical protein
MELTATGIVTDSHRIPYYPSLDDSNRDPFALQRYEKKYMMFGFGYIFLIVRTKMALHNALGGFLLGVG